MPRGMSTVTAADYGWMRTADVFRRGLEIGYALTLARGSRPSRCRP